MITKATDGTGIVLSTASERVLAASQAGATPLAAAADSNVKTPDYHLPYTGDQVSEGLKKAIELDVNSVGGVKILPSTSDEPYNIDTLLTPGSYVSNFIAATTFPDEFIGLTPVKIDITTKPGSIIQVIEAGGNKYYRWSKDNGVVWSEFAAKSTNSGPIDTSGDPTQPPPPDPMIEVNEKFASIDTTITGINTEITGVKESITKINTSLGEVISLGTAAVGTAILNGTFDYDAQ